MNISIPSRCIRVIVVILSCWAGGCLHAPQIEKTRYFTASPILQVEQAEPTAYTLGIRPFFAARAYALPMAYLDNAYQLKYRELDLWAESPALTVTRIIQDALATTGRFADVGNAADMVRPDLLLTGELRIYRENRTQDPPIAELEVRLELRRAFAPGSLWADTIHITEPMQDTSALSYAEAIARALNRLALQVASEITALPLPPKNSPTPPAEL